MEKIKILARQNKDICIFRVKTKTFMEYFHLEVLNKPIIENFISF